MGDEWPRRYFVPEGDIIESQISSATAPSNFRSSPCVLIQMTSQIMLYT